MSSANEMPSVFYLILLDFYCIYISFFENTYLFIIPFNKLIAPAFKTDAIFNMLILRQSPRSPTSITTSNSFRARIAKPATVY